MPCHWVKIRDPKTGEEFVAHINAGRTLPRKCAECGEMRADKLCDGPQAQGELLHSSGSDEPKTCDRPICRRCAIHVPPDADYCRLPACRAAASAAGRQLRQSTSKETETR